MPVLKPKKVTTKKSDQALAEKTSEMDVIENRPKTRSYNKKPTAAALLAAAETQAKPKAAPTKRAPARGRTKKADQVQDNDIKEEAIKQNIAEEKEEVEDAGVNMVPVEDAGVNMVPVVVDGIEMVADEDATLDMPSDEDAGVNMVPVGSEQATSSEPMEFTKFKVSRVINESALSKMITFVGKYNGDNAVVRLEKTNFDEAAMKKALGDKHSNVKQDFANDIYASYIFTPSNGTSILNDIKATVIWPANETVLAKYSRSEEILFSETPDAYLKVVEPFIENKVTKEKNYNQWVYNILDGQSETERVIFNDPDPDSGFMVVPDLKWAGDEKDLYLVAICHRRDIRSLRDLNDKHIILLKNIMTKGTKAIKDRYKKAKGQLRSYIHYHPSFYHFHVHFKMIDPSDYSSTDRDNLLSTVINNITLNKDYYKKSTLTYPLSQANALYQELKKAKRV